MQMSGLFMTQLFHTWLPKSANRHTILDVLAWTGAYLWNCYLYHGTEEVLTEAQVDLLLTAKCKVYCQTQCKTINALYLEQGTKYAIPFMFRSCTHSLPSQLEFMSISYTASMQIANKSPLAVFNIFTLDTHTQGIINHVHHMYIIRELVDSLCRNGADTQYCIYR